MRIEHIGDARLILADCMDIMCDMPDKAFDLAIVDPPYGDGGGIGRTRSGADSADGSTSTASGSQSRLRRTVRALCPPPTRTGGTWSKKYQAEGGCPNDIRHWDFAPPPEYFKELFRVSRFQIIWGGNYFALPPSRNFIVWRKLTISEGFSMAMAEYAWTNIHGNAKTFECAPQDSERFHPTQKPIALYRWLLGIYAKDGDKILDTHMGSGVSVVACAELGYPITAIEINEDYFSKALERIKIAYRQPRLFDEPRTKDVPQDLGL